MSVDQINDATYRAFISERPIAVIHFSAAWNAIEEHMRAIIRSAADEIEGAVNIGELDVDENPRTATAMKILTVPTVIYYRDGQVIEKVPGLAANKNAAERIKLLLSKSDSRT